MTKLNKNITCGLILALFSFFWQGWIYMLVILLCFRYWLACGLCIGILTFIWGWQYPVDIVKEAWSALWLFADKANPSLYSSVGELKLVKFPLLESSLGFTTLISSPMFMFTLIPIPLKFFTLMIAPLAIWYLWLGKVLYKSVLWGIIGGMFISCVIALPRHQAFIYNDQWDTVMTYIRDYTPQDSVIVTYWCPGHIIKAMGERAVIWDGGSIDSKEGLKYSMLFALNEYQVANIIGDKKDMYFLVWEELPIFMWVYTKGKLRGDSLISKMWLGHKMKHFNMEIDAKGKNKRVMLFKYISDSAKSIRARILEVK